MGKKNGFTLVELLVSIAILGILAAIATVVYSGVTAKARDSQRMRDLQTIAQALELYRSDFHSYPQGIDAPNFTKTGMDYPRVVHYSTSDGITILSTYLNPAPNDEASDREYLYITTNGSSYSLCAGKESNDIFDIPSDCSGNCGSVQCGMGISSR